MERKQPFDFFPSIWTRTAAGIFSFTGIMILVFWIAINEPARMEEFTQRSEGRSIEAGAMLFESNCASCHGPEGLGSGRAPALNNPLLLDYDFGLGALESQIVGLDKALTETTDTAELATLQLERDHAQAQYDLIVDDLIYDYSSLLEEAEADLAELDAEITAAGFDPSAVMGDATRLQAEIDALEGQLTGTAEAPGPGTLVDEAETRGEDAPAEVVAQAEELEAQIAERETQLEPIASFIEPRTTLTNRINDLRPLVEAHTPIHDARVELVELYEQKTADRSLPIDEQVTALKATIDGGKTTRQTIYDQLVADFKIVPFDANAVEKWTSTDAKVKVAEGTRMSVLKWNGSLHDLIFSTIAGGRPTSASYWDNPMAAWSQTAGGPLRGDQIENLADFVMNWQREFTTADVRKIEQFAKIPGAGGGSGEETIGTDVAAIITMLEPMQGDSNRGQQLFNSANYGCSACHGTAAAPDLSGVALRAEQHATDDPTNYPTARHYLVTSIVNPAFFAVEGFPPVMPPNFGDRITPQDAADIIAYLESLDQ